MIDCDDPPSRKCLIDEKIDEFIFDRIFNAPKAEIERIMKLFFEYELLSYMEMVARSTMIDTTSNLHYEADLEKFDYKKSEKMTNEELKSRLQLCAGAISSVCQKYDKKKAKRVSL